MTTLAVTFYDVVVWLHVSAVVVGFGVTFGFGFYFAIGAREDPRSIPAILKTQIAMNRTVVTGGMILILLTGLYLVGDSEAWDFSDFFVAWGIVAILVLFGLAHGYFGPHDRKALAAASRDIEASRGETVELSDEFNRESQASARMGPIAGLVVILTIYVMVAKPFL
jgi:hypothetical protein